MIDIPDVAKLRDRVGQEVGVSDWIDVMQTRIDQFAEATEDRQWIHVDASRAARDSPFMTTIAHGFLTLSLLSALSRRTMSFSRVRMAVNYGLNRVRFMSPVLAGSRIRGRFIPIAVDIFVDDDAVDDAADHVQVTWRVTVEREHGDKPCCVAEWLVRYYPME
jgi:acyl dehydratase